MRAVSLFTLLILHYTAQFFPYQECKLAYPTVFSDTLCHSDFFCLSTGVPRHSAGDVGTTTTTYHSFTMRNA